MRTTVELCRLLAIELSPEEAQQARILEALGQRFCVHFGLKNLTEKVREALEKAPTSRWTM